MHCFGVRNKIEFTMKLSISMLMYAFKDTFLFLLLTTQEYFTSNHHLEHQTDLAL
jgi:hypothetical protein